jgi:hypothetical protein
MVICPMSRISDIIRMRTSSAIYKTFTHIEMKKGINTVKPVLRGHLWDKEKVAL